MPENSHSDYIIWSFNVSFWYILEVILGMIMVDNGSSAMVLLSPISWCGPFLPDTCHVHLPLSFVSLPWMHWIQYSVCFPTFRWHPQHHDSYTPPLYSAVRKKNPLSFFPRRELVKGAHGCTSAALEHMHYTLVYADPTRDLWTPGTLLVAVLSRINSPIYPRSSLLFSHQTSWAVHQWLLLLCKWLIPCLLMLSCHQYYSIPFAFLVYYSADDSLPYQSILSCSLLISAYPLLTDRLQTPYKALTNPLPILDKFCLFPSLFVLQCCVPPCI